MTNDERASLSVRISAEIASDDQAWRETIIRRWAEYLRTRGNQLAAQAIALEMRAGEEPFKSDPVIVQQYGVMVANLRDLAERERNAAKLLDEGRVTLKDPAGCELVLRLWNA